MRSEKTVSYPKIGEVRYVPNRRARNLTIRIGREAQVRVTVPGAMSFERAEKFVFQKGQWIANKVQHIEREIHEKRMLLPGDLFSYLGGVIRIDRGTTAGFVHKRQGDSVTLETPMNWDGKNPGHQQALWDEIAERGKALAKEYLPGLMDHYSYMAGLSYNKLTIRRMRSRWGSCTAQDNISLSSGLIFLEEPLIQYVCLHELVHTVHKNHSREFWNALVEILPDAMDRRKLLRDKSIIA